MSNLLGYVSNPSTFNIRFVINYSNKNKVDPTLSYMLILENKMHEANLEISREKFINYGKELKLFPGVNEWFKKIKNLHRK